MRHYKLHVDITADINIRDVTCYQNVLWNSVVSLRRGSQRQNVKNKKILSYSDLRYIILVCSENDCSEVTSGHM